MNEETRTAVSHLLWVWFQYVGYRNKRGVVCLPHRCMTACEEAGDFLQEHVLAVDNGWEVELTAASEALMSVTKTPAPS